MVIIGLVLAAALLSGCQTLLPLGQGGAEASAPPESSTTARRQQDEASSELSVEDFLAGLFGRGCQADISEDCAEREATTADECLRQAITLPHTVSYHDTEMRRLLDCAESHYRKALRLSSVPSGAVLSDSAQASNRREAYHGGLLLALSERRNRLDNNTGERQAGRENDKLLNAADAVIAESPDNALGFLYGASARLYRAALLDDQELKGHAKRCADLREAAALLSDAPPPPEALIEEQTRLSALAAVELERCNSLSKMAARLPDHQDAAATADTTTTSD